MLHTLVQKCAFIDGKEKMLRGGQRQQCSNACRVLRSMLLRHTIAADMLIFHAFFIRYAVFLMIYCLRVDAFRWLLAADITFTPP